jgi:ketosteroid isomerase-like protein/Flp pilus assembly protein TadD
MKTFLALFCLAMISSSSVVAQSKGEMPFSCSTKNANKLLRQSWVALADAKIEEGNQYTRQLLMEDPTCGMAYVSIAGANEEELTENIRKAESMNLSADERLFVQGIKASTQKQSTLAYFSPLLKKYPKDDYLHLIVMLMSQYEPSAIEIGENIIKRNQKFAPAHNLLGYQYMNKNDMAKAEAHFNKYIALRPDLANPYDSKGDYLMRAGKIEEAVSMYEKAASMGMKSSAARAAKARARLKFPEPSEKDASEIKDMITTSFAGYISGNVNETLKAYADQSIEIFGNQRVNVGITNLRKRLEGMYKLGAFLKQEPSIDFVNGAGGIAVAYGKTESLRKSPDSGKEVSSTENMIFIMRRQDNGEWKILIDHFYPSEQNTQPLSPEDRQSIQQMISKWDLALPTGETITAKHFDAFSEQYSAQAIEVLPSQISNIGIANLRARWEQNEGAKMETNSLSPISMEGLGRRAVVWGIGKQEFYTKDSQELRKFEFPWAMIVSKEKDDAWRILAIHWYSN